MATHSGYLNEITLNLVSTSEISPLELLLDNFKYFSEETFDNSTYNSYNDVGITNTITPSLLLTNTFQPNGIMDSSSILGIEHFISNQDYTPLVDRGIQFTTYIRGLKILSWI